MKKLVILIALAVCFSFGAGKKYRGIIDYIYDLAKGNVPGETSLNIAGANSAVPAAGADVWAGGGDYGFYPDTAHPLEIVRDSSADDTGGVGARTVVINGLDSNWLEVADTVSITGDTVALVNYYIRVHSAQVLTAGSAKSNAGNLSIQDSTGALVGAYIAAGAGRSQQAVYTVPADKTALIVKGYFSAKSNDTTAETAGFSWVTRDNSSTAGVQSTRPAAYVRSDGASAWAYRYGVSWGLFEEKTDIKIRCFEASDTVATAAGFDIILIDD